MYDHQAKKLNEQGTFKEIVVELSLAFRVEILPVRLNIAEQHRIFCRRSDAIAAVRQHKRHSMLFPSEGYITVSYTHLTLPTNSLV